ncbi:preprotein translocase subunit SecG [Candidatus Nitrosoglobus terrae]|uniref:Protein-export membrane protein SecG n=1 Tax=Candidatus Nitrosoglobus terrae TaxID=1630141 RepID=A0A1Q2SKV4_9GAMM|nr:preprotein translocase subunit SecG [Candidatus Nitrosoglobus terrae]BAW79776.1 preprotein translocase subunit SecG [Candidatus Nitrosoglobus terrae]
MHSVLLVLHITVAIGLAGLVLIQHGKGADAGAAFGSGASATVFGASGSANFLTRASAILATLFFITSLSLAYFSERGPQKNSVTQAVKPRIIADENMVIPPLASPPNDDLSKDKDLSNRNTEQIQSDPSAEAKTSKTSKTLMDEPVPPK